MSLSDTLELIGILASTITSIIAIVISVLTLKQNSKMIEDSSRPYIGIYGLSTYVCDRNYYIILKNYGTSTACIESLTYDFDIALLSKNENYEPFSHIDGASIAPGQSYRCAIDFDKATQRKLTCINFHVRYSSGVHKYEDDISLKIDANLGNLEAHTKSEEEKEKKKTPLVVISETLQDMHIKSL